MASIGLKSVTKKFGKITALNDVTLDIHNNEFFVVFGPAGAGKTTLLNVIAGIVLSEYGAVEFDGKSMNDVEPRMRNVSMVFENYALYPNMTAYDNIASPLRSKLNRKSEEEIKTAVTDIARKLHIYELLDRLPSKVSNGQKQRIALGRALVRHPNVFLLDEPLAHLDAKLRHAMRKELKFLQRSLDTTVVYVTHDYTEAMSLADRIAIIDKGVIQQVGTPNEVYYTPANEFVARLFGDLEINMLRCAFDGNGIVLPWQDKRFIVKDDVKDKLKKAGIQMVNAGIRAGNIDCSVTRKGEEQIQGMVYSLEPLGNRTEIVVKIDDQLLRFMGAANSGLSLDQPIFLTIDMDHAVYFDCEFACYIVRHGEDKLRRGESIGKT